MKLFLRVLLLPLVVSPAAQAQYADEEALFSEPVKGSIVEQIKYEYIVRDYKEPISVPNEISMREIHLNSPEDAAIAHFNAMLMGDYGRWLSLWDQKTRASLIAEHHKNKQDADFWMRWWFKGFYDTNEYHLTRRVDYGDYIIIEMTAQGSGGKILQLDVPIKRIGAHQWRPTEDIKKDPVFENWRKMNFTLSRNSK